MDAAGSAVAIMRIRDVCICDWNASFLHLCDPGKGNSSFHAIEARKADMSCRVLDHSAVEICHRSAWLDDGIDVLGTEKTVEITVIARLVGQ